MRTFDLTTLQLFVFVCEAGSVAGAAERASLVTSAVSKRLSQLEAQIGTPLLARKRHGMVPTGAGQTLLEHARALLHGAERMDRDLKAYAAGGWGQVRVLASVSSMMESLVPDIASFLRNAAHASIHVDMEERSSPGVVEGVRQGLASLGVGWDAVDLSGLRTRPYRWDELCLVVPPRHPMASRKRVKFEEILGFDLVGQPMNSTLQVLLHRLAAEAGRPLQQRIVIHSYEAALRVVGAGLAVSIVPRPIAQLTGVALGLKQITLDEPWALRRFVICFRHEESLTPAAKLLLEHLLRVSQEEEKG